METTTMPLQAGWSTASVDCGEQCVTICGEVLTLLLCVGNLD